MPGGLCNALAGVDPGLLEALVVSEHALFKLSVEVVEQAAQVEAVVLSIQLDEGPLEYGPDTKRPPLEGAFGKKLSILARRPRKVLKERRRQVRHLLQVEEVVEKK